jgi:hypothetical protein
MAKVAILIHAPTNVIQSQKTYLPRGVWIIEMANVTVCKLVLDYPAPRDLKEVRHGDDVLMHIDGPVHIIVSDIVSKGPATIYAVKVKAEPG